MWRSWSEPGVGLSKRSRYWTVLRTKQASSRDAVQNISRQGFSYYHALYRDRPSRGVRRIRPLFPHYLLVQIDPHNDAWKALPNTRGVSHLFMSDDRPARVPDEHVEFFREQENEIGYYEDPKQEAPRFTAGQHVRGTGGLFDECVGVYQGLAGPSRDRVRVLFSLLGKPTALEVSAYDLAAA